MTRKILKNTSPAERLANHLGGLPSRVVSNAATKAKISTRQAANAILARPLSTDAFLRLASASGYNPTPSLPWTAESPIGDFDFVMLAMGLRIKRGLIGHSERDAAKAMECSATSVNRLENADKLSIHFVLRACLYLGAHPWGFVRCPEKIGKYSNDFNTSPNISRETLNGGSVESGTREG